MNFRQFEALYWIGRLGSFQAAARHLNASQPAISARIREMEIELGVTLFDRSERKVRPTAKGRELLPYAAQMMTIASEIRECVGTREALVGRVRFGVTGVSALTWMRGLLARMAFDYPGIIVELIVDRSETLWNLIEAGALDVAVLAGTIESRKVVSEPVGMVPTGWLASPKLDLPADDVTGAELTRWPLILDGPGDHLQSIASKWLREEGVEPPLIHRCPGVPTRLQLAALGLGVALAPPAAAQREVAQGLLRPVRTARPLPPLAYFIAYSELNLSPVIRIVAETAKLVIAQKPDLESYYSASEQLVD